MQAECHKTLPAIKDSDSEKAFLYQAIYQKAQGDLLRKPDEQIAIKKGLG